jgi:hypothetical protein
LTKRRTRLSLSLTELMFQVARRKRMRNRRSDLVSVKTNLAPERWWEKRQPSHLAAHQQERAPDSEEAPDTGGSGLLRVPYGGNLRWGGKTHQKNGISLVVERRDDFLPQLVNLNAGKVAHIWSRIQCRQKKGAQPLRVVGRQKRVILRACAGREAGTSESHLRLDGGHYR